MKIYCKMTCGCLKLRSELEYINKKYPFCPNHHGSQIECKAIFCIKCGVIRYFDNGNPELCNKCQHEKRKAQWTEQNNKRKKHKKKKKVKVKKIYPQFKHDHLRDDSRWDCVDRGVCSFKYQEYDSIPCKNCKQYEKMPVYVDALRVPNDWLSTSNECLYNVI